MTHTGGEVFDRFDIARSFAAPGPLDDFNAAGVITAADVHTATTICRLAGDDRPAALLATALAVRAPRFGHVCVDLDRVRQVVTGADESPVDPTTLAWPDTAAWLSELRDSPLVAHVTAAATGEGVRPLVLDGTLLYLDRYWRYERAVAADLRARATAVDDADADAVRAALDELYPGTDEPDLQRVAAATAVLRRLTVIAGGPGTGKTTTVARLLALLLDLSDDLDRPSRIALVAPTGKAADRLAAAIHAAADELDVSQPVRRRLREAQASTIHRLLGTRPGMAGFVHHRGHPLPHDLVVVDETSMVPLSLMARLLGAVRHRARLVLVGDPDQLASVEAGAVLGDIIGPARDGARWSAPARRRLSRATGHPLPDEHRRSERDEVHADRDAAAVAEPSAVADGAPATPAADTSAAGASIGDSIVVLRRVHRFAGDSGIATLAAAVQRGDGDAAVAALTAEHPDVAWVDIVPTATGDAAALAGVRTAVVDAGRAIFVAATDGDGPGALAALGRVRVLCAHRRGPAGVAGWTSQIERWLGQHVAGYDVTGTWYVGRPVLVTHNDARLRLFNGDTGVVVTADDGVAVAFTDGTGARTLRPSRLEATDTVHAMTIHKSQGSQFDHVVVVLPDAASRLLTRELLYTAVTRGSRQVTVVGRDTAIRAAIDRRVARASGLRRALWGAAAGDA